MRLILFFIRLLKERKNSLELFEECYKPNKQVRSYTFNVIISGFLFFIFISQCVLLNAQRPIDHVNMFIGSTGKHSTEYGGTIPAVSEPFGMTQWCAATRVNGISKTSYHYDDNKLIGFIATHQPAIWMGDYGFFTLMPQVGKIRIDSEKRAVKLDHSQEVASPYYYKINYEDSEGNAISTEFTATSRCGFFKIKYPVGKALLFLEAAREKDGGGIEILPGKQEIRIYNKERHDSHLGPRLYNFKGYYVLKFSEPFVAYGTWNNDDVFKGKCSENGSHVGGYIEFEDNIRSVEVRIGSSFIDYTQAVHNLNEEIPSTLSFEQVKESVKEEWEKNLNKILIKDASDEDLDIFYTSFFRTMQYPREFSEYGRYYSPFDDRIHDGVSYNAYSFWDTFRAQHPWLQLTQPQRVNDMITALIQMYQEGGWLPKWPNPTYTNIMIGTHADAIIADAFINGFRGYDVEKAYEAVRKDAFCAPSDNYRWGDRHYWNGGYEARGGLKEYLQLGYVASDKTNESVSRTMEFALDDYCIAQMAKELQHEEDYLVLMKRSRNYLNLFNHQTGFFQARKSDGSWDSPEEGFTEGGKWTYRFCVMQNVPDLINMMGGKNAFCDELDRNFNEGHYRHDNEPGHHFSYLYDYCDRLDKVQERVPIIMKQHYQDRPDGLSGNDDCGQMSAWYLFSALGFYPLTPASGEYALGIPHFKELSISLNGGKKLVIKTSDLGEGKPLTYIRMNGRLLEKPFIPVREIMQGGILEFSSR